MLPSWVDAYIGYRAESKSGWDVIAAPHWVMPVKVAGNAVRPLPVLYRGCVGVFYCCERRHCRHTVDRKEWYWRDVDREEHSLRICYLDLDGCDIWVIARYLTV